jgi:hypothetical protein
VVLNEDGGVIYAAEHTPGCTTGPVDCLGEQYVLRKTRSMTDAMRTKVQMAAQLVEKQLTELLTCRQLAAVFGVCFFATSNFSLAPKAYFDSLFFYRQLSLFATEQGWSSLAPRLPSVALEQTRHWILALLAHAHVPILEAELPIDATITFDACDLGWGAIIQRANGSVHVCARPWSTSDLATHQLWSSVVSEPLACVRAACFGVGPGMRHVRLISDHAGLVFAGGRQYARCRSYNDCLQQLEALFPDVRFSFAFIAGAQNRADSLSRGLVGWSPDFEMRTPAVCVPWAEMPSVRVG